MVECDEIIVPEQLWQRARSGDVAAKAELRRKLNGLTLYVHALHWPEPHIVISAREACRVLDDMLTLTIGFDNG